MSDAVASRAALRSLADARPTPFWLDDPDPDNPGTTFRFTLPALPGEEPQ